MSKRCGAQISFDRLHDPALRGPVSSSNEYLLLIDLIARVAETTRKQVLVPWYRILLASGPIHHHGIAT